MTLLASAYEIEQSEGEDEEDGDESDGSDASGRGFNDEGSCGAAGFLLDSVEEDEEVEEEAGPRRDHRKKPAAQQLYRPQIEAHQPKNSRGGKQQAPAHPFLRQERQREQSAGKSGKKKKSKKEIEKKHKVCRIAMNCD
jgi:hypothetical protein